MTTPLSSDSAGKGHRDEELKISSRENLFSKISDSLSSVQREGRKGALLQINVISLKQIYHTFGFDAGDGLLALAFTRIKHILKQDDLILRTNENEFTLLLPNLMNQGHAILATNRILEQFSKKFDISNEKILASVATGIAIYPDHGHDAEDLYIKSSMALENALANHLPYDVFQPKDDDQLESGLLMQSQLRNAIDNNELDMHYMAKLDIKRKTITGIEALARWEHPQLGFIIPDYFIKLAEQSNQINQLTATILNTTLKELKKFRGIGLDLNVSINLSAMNLQDETLLHIIQRAVNLWDIDPHRIFFEVTESAMMHDPESSHEMLKKINELGAKCSIDDFGTGHSSLAYLKKMEVSELKIDKSFVLNMTEDPEDRVITDSIINLGHNFGLEVTAEGVESEESLELLASMGCDYAQGFYLARPIPQKEFIAWVKDTHWDVQKKK